MIFRRSPGLTHLYVLAVAGLATGLFFAWVPLAHQVGLPKLSSELELWRYGAAVILGVGIGAPFWAHRVVSQPILGWRPAARIATRQVVFLALAIFALIVGTKDPAFSRLFLSSYLLLTWAVLVGVNRRLVRMLAGVVFPRRQGVATVIVGTPARVTRAPKRGFDLLIALPMVLFVLPVLCLMIWLVQRRQSPGPLLFVRPRGGRNGLQFGMPKFRTMHAAAPDAATEGRQASHSDTRIYPPAMFLHRRWLHNRHFPSLNELALIMNAQFKAWSRPDLTLKRLCNITPNAN